MTKQSIEADDLKDYKTTESEVQKTETFLK